MLCALLVRVPSADDGIHRQQMLLTRRRQQCPFLSRETLNGRRRGSVLARKGLRRIMWSSCEAKILLVLNP